LTDFKTLSPAFNLGKSRTTCQNIRRTSRNSNMASPDYKTDA